MRTLKQNKQTMFYANFVDKVPIYALDEDGNVLTTEVDDEEIPVIEDYKSGYSTPIRFKANISANSGETRIAEFGLNESDYDAIIVADKGKFPFTEQTLIWHKSEPIIDEKDNMVRPESADYRVVAIKTSLNEERFILKKRVDDNETKG